MMKNLTQTALATLLASATFGCSFHARSPEAYSEATSQTLVTKSPEMQSCYEQILKTDNKAGGVVAVNFTVEAKTGAIVDPKIDEEKTTAPEAVRSCVLDNMAGLKVDPPDAREGVASFAYNFQANPPKHL